MTKSLVTTPANTAFGTPHTHNLSVPLINWNADYRILSQSPGEVVFTDVLSTIDRPRTFRVSQRVKPNVYAGTNIDPSVYLPNRQGLDTLIEYRDVLTITDSGDATYRADVPVKVGITISVPVGTDLVDATLVADTLLPAAIAGCFNPNEASPFHTGMTDLLHGVLVKRADG